VRALGPLAYQVSPPGRAGVLLVGDALGFLDPFTGEGLHTALRSAELAAEVAHDALRAGDVTARALAPAHRRRRAELAGKGRLAALLQAVIASRPLADLAARRLRDRPALLGRLMGVLGDFVPARELIRPGSLWSAVTSGDPVAP
jgi:flavin-dependent dehydrogenase